MRAARRVTNYKSPIAIYSRAYPSMGVEQKSL